MDELAARQRARDVEPVRRGQRERAADRDVAGVDRFGREEHGQRAVDRAVDAEIDRRPEISEQRRQQDAPVRARSRQHRILQAEVEVQLDRGVTVDDAGADAAERGGERDVLCRGPEGDRIARRVRERASDPGVLEDPDVERVLEVDPERELEVDGALRVQPGVAREAQTIDAQIEVERHRLGEIRRERQVEAQNAVTGVVDQAEIQQRARLGEPERFLELVLEYLDRAGRVGRRLVQRG